MPRIMPPISDCSILPWIPYAWNPMRPAHAMYRCSEPFFITDGMRRSFARSPNLV